MSGHVVQDWEPVVLRKHPTRPTQVTGSAAEAARQAGAHVESVKKFSTGNPAAGPAGPSNAAKLDAAEEAFALPTVSLDIRLAIQQARQEKKMTQKDLATKINEKQSVVNDYESGKAIPNNEVLGKLERALGVKLRGKGKGKGKAN